MKRIGILLTLCITAITLCPAQLPHTFTQYTSEDGLAQKNIQGVIQDHKGIMWFATWDGLYEFDGYTFKNYKAHPGDSIGLSNNRLDNIKEDRYGYIWVQSYDHHVYRFNPKTEQFQAIPYSEYSSQSLYVLPCGDVWVVTVQNELIHITTHPETGIMKASNFRKTYQIPHLERVNRVWQDQQQNRWILTENGLYKLSTRGNKTELSSYFVAPPQKDKLSFYDALESGNTIYFTSKRGDIYELNLDNNQFTKQKVETHSSLKIIRRLKDDKLLICTASDGFFIYEQKSKNVRHYNTRNYPSLKDDYIRDVYIDSHNDIWIRHQIKGVTHFNPEKEKFDYFILQDKYGKDITGARPEVFINEDINGFLWVHPSGGGLALYDREKNRIRPFYNPALQSGWSSDNRVTAVFTDKQGNLWFASFDNGLQKVSFSANRFQLLTSTPDDPEFPGNNIRAIYQDRDGYIWTGGKDKAVRIYDKNLHYVGNLTKEGTVSMHRADQLGVVYTIMQDHEGVIWIGTKGNGLFAARPGNKPLNYHLTQYTTDTDNAYSLSGNEIYSLHEDSRHRIWIATFEGGINYLERGADKEDVKFINYRNRLKDYPISQCYRTRFVTSDPEGRIWIGSSDGLLMCNGNYSKAEDIVFHRYHRIPGDSLSLSNNDIHNIFFTRNKEMYVGTFGGGLNKLISFDHAQARFHAYTMKDGFPSDVLLSIEEDKTGNLWCATEEELYKFNPDTETFISYPSRVFPRQVIFNEGAALHTQSGQLMYNTIKGILYFLPDSIKTSNYIPPIIFTNLQQAKKTITPAEGGILTTHIDDTKLLKLPHDKNSFSIQFAALDMKYPDDISYSYRLEGFENNWNDIGNQRTATYTNLPKGHYTLKVRSTNSDGIWVDNTRTLAITVLPSFWETPWAYSLYVLFILLIIFAATYILFTIFRLKHKVSVEQEISDIKLRFFTNISHELRTPLTLIAGPIEHVLQHGKLDNEAREQLVLVERNTNRMLRLVNQILDFRKIQNRKMKMRVQQIDLIPFIRHIMESFNSLADEHQIDFGISTQSSSLKVWADPDKLEKIVFNLLSNAFKYTPRGKQIQITVHEGESDVSIAVEDQGIGIAENKQNSLFVRFENLVDKNLFNQASTGIGLSLVKELIDMHHGTISIRSKPGEGSCFTVRLPKGKEHFDPTVEFILSDYVISDDATAHAGSHLPSFIENEEENLNTEKETILIVEDNRELRFFIRTIFAQYFNVIEAEDGVTGLEKSRKYLPDIIISDVMMPEKDGISMARELREDITTSHIPIVMLTAKSTIESKIEGMELGVDDYITKPFSATYLKARIFNLLEQRKKLQALYCASLLPSSTEQQSEEAERVAAPTLSPNDRKFMDKVMETIEGQLDNGDLMVEDIAGEVNMSRSVFFKKLKTLTGLSPVEFLREIRMKRAAQLIETEEHNMAQIAYMVGLNDSHYFSKCFKQQYGITPTEYKERWKQKTPSGTYSERG
ncbi:hybrid sensor histidine kinase/response regulator transcription factor [Bacteroides sp. UBA939]|uniref:hybrid sensor histidine kinase/response regulator transcription factor n=1 Tax=Bacteroides sp. UBA939 TaxID=1946092 RepID=UPI0025BFDF3F|nr:two-component regulator propeller domain-containing protein [Bacteroides sp. UBA939]